MKNLKSICISVLLGLSLIISQSSAQNHQVAASTKLDSLLDELSSKNKFMGCVTIRKNDQILFNKAYGSALISGDKKQVQPQKRNTGSVQFPKCSHQQ